MQDAKASVYANHCPTSGPTENKVASLYRHELLAPQLASDIGHMYTAICQHAAQW